ncbi:MAG: acyl-ACP--UDP-N- acetylglucosamine O-acyltransferase [Actinomycetota bacterium]|nr:acyl-ACP--UDP-N- acetylglucosamine O-acyltransferase [Actinomycetota bacterium]
MNQTQETSIHPTAFVGPGVEVGVGVSIGPHAVLLGPTVIGDGVWIGPAASIGAPPEITSLRHNRAWEGDLDHAGVVVEERAVIRELVVVHQGSTRPTIVGSGSWLLNHSYLAHDVQLGADVVISAGVSIGGGCTIREAANIGLNASVHQFRSIGARAMVGMGSTVTRDVPPFAKVFGVPLRLHGVNRIGMERAGIDPATIAVIERSYGMGSVDLPIDDSLHAVVAAEFAWWESIEHRRPVSLGDEA